MAIKDCEKGIILYIMGSSRAQQFEVVMTEEERRKQLNKLESEACRMQKAMVSEDPSIARSVYNDKEMNWLCKNCPYKEKCRVLELSSLQIFPEKQHPFTVGAWQTERLSDHPYDYA